MNRIPFALLTGHFFLSSWLFSLTPATHVQLKGVLVAPSYIADTPPHTIMFNGMSTKSDIDGFFTLLLEDDEKINQFPILFTAHVEPEFLKRNTIINTVIKQNKPHKLFRPHQDEEGVVHWRETTLGTNATVPEKYVTVFMNPRLVDHVEDWNTTFHDNIHPLARIVLKKTTTPASLKTSSDKSLLYTTDIARFTQPVHHARNVITQQNQQKEVIAVY